MFSEIALEYKGDLQNIHLYPAVKERRFWEGLPEDIKESLVKSGEELIGFSYPMITACLYMEFSRSGNRSKFEGVYTQRRKVLNALILAECVEGKGRFLDDIINGITAICEESGWQLPAHNYYLKWAPIYSIPDKKYPVIDLYAAETGALLATAAYLLNEELKEACPLLLERIDMEIYDRILEPYLRGRFRWTGGWDKEVNNWTVWITRNILLSLFSGINMSERDKYQVFHQAARSLDYFYDQYGEDGCCNEGPGYYRHSGLCFFESMEIMNIITSGAYSELFREAKMNNIAAYIMNAHVENEYYLNFGDNSCKPGASGIREFLFARGVGNEEMMNFAATEHKRDNDPLLKSSYNLFNRLQATFGEKDIREYNTVRCDVKRDIWYESTGLLIARDSKYVLAVKGGGNNDSHNHNDTGSFILYKNGKPLIIDIGVETYCHKTFSAERYEIWTMQSAWHNVFNFGEVNQLAGAEYQSKLINWKMEKEIVSMGLELSGVYPKDTVKSYMRSFCFAKEKEIAITDSFDAALEGACFSLITVEKPMWDGERLLLGEMEQLLIEPVKLVEIDEVEIRDIKLKSEWGNKIYRTRIYPVGNSLVTRILNNA